MKYKIPDNFMGIPIEGAMEKALSNPNSNKIIIPNNIQPQNKDNFIYVPSINLYVAKEKILFNHDWYKTHEELEKLNLRMYTPAEEKAFLDYLFKNEQTGTPDASKQDIEKILDEMLTQRDPWIAECLDAYFEEKDDGMYILTKNKSQSEKLEPYVMKDCYVTLSSFNNQGFPTGKSGVQKYKKGVNIYFCHPRNGAVARFVADSDRAYLYCSRDPTYSSASLGVRPCAEGTALKN